MSTWYIRDRGRVIGPFGTDQLLDMREAGQVQGYVEVSPDQRRWKALDLVPEMALPADVASEFAASASRRRLVLWLAVGAGVVGVSAIGVGALVYLIAF